MNQPVAVTIYGDSIMRGTVTDETMRYHATVGTLLENLSRRFGLCFQNRARFGITIQKGRALLEKDARQGLAADYAVLEFGGNDCSFHWDEIAEDPLREHLPFTPLAEFEQTADQMVCMLQEAGVQPVLATLPPVDAERHLHFIGKTEEGRRNILQWLGDVQMIYRFHELYSDTLARVAVRTGSLLVDVRRSFLDKHNLRELIGPDGVHPSGAGYALVVETFERFILQKRAGQDSLLFA